MPLLLLPLLVRGISKPRLYYLNKNKQYWRYAIASAKTEQRRLQSSSSSLLKLRGGDDGGSRNSNENDDQTTIQYKAIQVQIIHRHGDRTPITTMRDVEYWKSQLIAPQIIEKISEGTRLIKRHNQPSNTHQAYGQGPFGKLTQLGLFQLIDVGTTIRQELVCSKGESTSTSEDDSNDGNNNAYYDGTLFDEHNNRPLHPKYIKIISTDFPRTIQSVQGLLIGLFPDGLPQEVEIDCRHTNWMIPDPQPRHTQEQSLLENQLSQRSHLRSKEKDMRELAVRCTESLRELLGKNAFDVSYGVGEDSSQGSKKKVVLPWAQLAEITTCLRVRDMLPPTISDDDQQQISNHCAWRWFESLRNPRLCYLAMHHFTHTILHSMRHFVADDEKEPEEPPLIIYSGHDSTLIGLLCAFRLEQPSIWPEYGSYLKIELLEKQSIANNSNNNEVVVVDKEYVVRFYLNGNLLRSQWQKQHDDDQQGDGEGGEFELRDEISLQELSHYISTEGSKTTSNYDEILK